MAVVDIFVSLKNDWEELILNDWEELISPEGHMFFFNCKTE